MAWGSRGKLGLAAIALAVLALATAALQLSWPVRVKGNTPAERIASITHLANDHPTGAEDAIAAAARDSDASVRRAALLCLARFHRASDEDLFQAGLHDADPSVRGAAALGLARYADDAATEGLREMALGDADAALRLHAAQALCVQKTAAATAALVELMENSQDAAVRRMAADLLKKMAGIYAKADPADPAEWNNLVEVIKNSDGVGAAYRALNRPLEHHPERLIPGPAVH